ncbi:MAG TPA: cytochrome c oxidase subunit II, partial [Gemmatimonadaceae bacterium]
GLFWVMTGASVLIWSGVVGLAIYAMYFRSSPIDTRTGRRLIIGGGVIFPVIVLAVLLIVGLSMLPGLLAPAPAGALRVQVTGHQWWWHIRYLPDGGTPFEVANELHLPVGQPVQLELNGRDVIHSFWIPSIGGKVDMIPGRQTRLRLQPTRTGVFQGACAEYCGTSHAQMRLVLVVEEPAAFAQWMAAQSGEVATPGSPPAQRGAGQFLANGCGGCHTIRGTEARGVIGPDLTHVGSRLTIGAGVLENSAAAIRRFIADPAAIKPGALMPSFGMLPDEDLRDLAAYLAERR